MPNSDITELTQALSRLAQRTSDLRPTLGAIAQYQMREYQKAFDANRTPEGEPWQPLAESTRLQKRNTKPLVETIGRIPASRFSEVQGNSAIVGYGDPLAALHDSGYTIPARTVVPVNRRALYFAGLPHPIRRANIPATTVPARGLIGYSEENIRSWIEIVEDDIAGEFD